MSAGISPGLEFAIDEKDRPAQEKLKPVEIKDTINFGLRDERRRAGNLPDMTDWEGLKDPEKLERMRQLLKKPLWLISEQMGDQRTRGLEHNPLVTPYFNLVMPWPEAVLKSMAGWQFIDRIHKGEFDEMIWELSEKGKLLPGQAADEQYLELGSSTGGAPSLRQYCFGLQYKKQMEAIVQNANDWPEARGMLEVLQKTIAIKLKEIYDLPEEIKVLFTQSGTEAELLLPLFGVEASQCFNETGSATKDALAGRHPSPITWLGKKVKGVIAGLEKLSEPKEISMRNEKGEIRDSKEIRSETEAWIQAQRAGNPEKRLALHVVAGGSKTGIAYQGSSIDIGGLAVKDAQWLRDKYGGKDGNGIIVMVDLAQNRLDFSEVQDLLKLGFLVNITGSKFPGGAMFSHAMFVPPELVQVMQERVKANGIPDGLKDYLTKSDIADVLGKNETEGLPDLSNIASVCKWAEAIPTMQEFAEIYRDRAKRRNLQEKAYDLMTAIMNQIHKVSNESSQNLFWSARWLQKRDELGEVFQESIGLEALAGFFVQVMGRTLSVAQIKELYQHVADFRLDEGIHLGQAVEIEQETQEAVLRIAPSMEFLLRLLHESKRGNTNYRNIVAERIAGKLDRVIEAGFIAATPILTPMTEKPEVWSKWVLDNNHIFNESLKKCQTMEQKLNLSVQLLAQMWKSGKMAPVVVASGKSAAVLEVAHLAYQEAGLKGELPIAFVDHPYVNPETRLNFRAALLRYRELKTNVHLYVFAASEEMKELAKDEAISSMVTIVSDAPPTHEIVTADPQWMVNLAVNNADELNKLNEMAFEIRQNLANKLNEYYKAAPTRQLIDFFKAKFGKVQVQFLQGHTRYQPNRQRTQLMQLPDSKTFINLYPLVAFTDKDKVEFNRQHLILIGDDNDPFKAVMQSLQCGMAETFINY